MLKIGEWLFDAATRRVLQGPDERKLSPKASGVLCALAETPGQVWSRDALLERVWPGVTVGEEVLTHAIAELRRALGDDFRSPRYLRDGAQERLSAAAGTDRRDRSRGR